MHSTDFKYREKISEKTKEEWEVELELIGIIKHLNDLGWKTYQWRYQEVLDNPKKRKEYGDRLNNLTHFAEFFSEYYKGYLRGDSKNSLREAMEICLNEAQRHSECENKTGHQFVPYKRRKEEYTNGLIECSICGFNGYTSLVEVLEQERNHYKNLVNILNSERATFLRNAKEVGVSFNMLGDVITD